MVYGLTHEDSGWASHFEISWPPMRFVFITAMTGFPWAGSEELWGAATLALANQGHDVAALIPHWPHLAPQHERLAAAGVEIKMRSKAPQSLATRVFQRLRHSIRPSPPADLQWLRSQNPDLVCVSHGNYYDGISYLEWCRANHLPFVSISQANAEWLWPHDDMADRIIAAYGAARRSFFVSEGNRDLATRQLGLNLQRTEVVRNPFNVPWDSTLAWPDESPSLRMACVARLDPSAKGHDILFRVLTMPKWRERPLRISLFGAGPMERSMRRLVTLLGLDETVSFRGHVQDVQQIWQEHHALVLPSRYEGLPLAIVEAMLCGRLAVVTDVAGNCELLEDGVTGFAAAAPTVGSLDDAMERAWLRRDEWRSIGEAAQRTARERLPPDPAGAFAARLISIAGS